MLAIAVLSEVDAAPGPYRAVPGELAAVFANLDLIAAGEGQGDGEDDGDDEGDDDGDDDGDNGAPSRLGR